MTAANPTPPPASRIALVAGASGLVGQHILRALLADSGCAAVHSLGRRVLDVAHPRLVQHRVDFAALPTLPAVTEAYIALGTTIRVAGSQAAFRAVDFEAVIAVARAARSRGATRLGVVSAMGASASSAVFYNRVKGEMEQALQAMGYEVLVIARPALLAGDRAALGQPQRGGESAGLRALRHLQAVIPRNYRPIAAESVATALVQAVPARPPGTHILLSGEMQVS